MTGLEFTSEAAKQLEKVYLARDIVPQRVEQFGTSICLGVRGFWISDVVRAICAKAWGKSLVVTVRSSALIFRPI